MPTPNLTVNFTASSTSINPNDHVVLQWVIPQSNAGSGTTATMTNSQNDQSWHVGFAGSYFDQIVVAPCITTTYTITITDQFGQTATASVTVTVILTVTLTASVNPVVSGSNTTLTWTSVNASTLSIDNGVGTVTPSNGSTSVTVTNATTFTITATSACGDTATASVAVQVKAYLSTTRNFITATGTYTVPSDFISLASVECIGGGGGGGGVGSGLAAGGGGGGGGGAYAKITSIAGIAIGTVYTVHVSPQNLSGSGIDTWFKDASTVLAKPGADGSSVAAGGGVGGAGGGGGSSGSSVGTTVYSGGAGAAGRYAQSGGFFYPVGGGGGGAAGPNGAGNNAPTPPTPVVGVANYGGSGGQGDLTFGGSGAVGVNADPPTNGAIGTEFDSSHGSGGGGSGLYNNTDLDHGVGAGGKYGGGGGGGLTNDDDGQPLHGLGASGLIVFTYFNNTLSAPFLPITASLSASPSTIVAGSSSVLTWSSANSTTRSIDQGIGSVEASGTQSVSPTTTTTYTLTLSGSYETTVTKSANVTVTTLPAPTGITATQSATANQINLSWVAPPTYTSFKVFRATSSGGSYSQIATPSGTTYTDTPPSAFTSYFYVIQTVNNAVSSANSAEVNAQSGAIAAVPSTPTVTAYPGTLLITWPVVAHANSYNLYRGSTPGGETLYLSTIKNAFYNDAVLSGSTSTWYYTVTSVDVWGESAQSGEASGIPGAVANPVQGDGPGTNYQGGQPGLTTYTQSQTPPTIYS